MSSGASSIRCRRSKARTKTAACGKASRIGSSRRAVERPVVEAEEDRLGVAGAGEAEQVEPGAVAIIDLGAEGAAELDLARLGIDQGDGDALGHQHLGDGLAEAAVADDDRLGRSDSSGPSRPSPSRRLERRSSQSLTIIRNGVVAIESGDDGAEQARRRRLDEQGALGRGEQDEAELAALAEQQAELRAPAATPSRTPWRGRRGWPP